MALSAHPYIPNTAENTRKHMLAAVGAESIEDVISPIPQRLRAPEDIGLAPGLVAESELRRYFTEVLAQNTDTSDTLSFLGGGCWKHTVPAVCDEIASRGEFTSAFQGMGGASTTGAYQALFEYQSLIAELTGLDTAPMPVYDWAWAASTGLLMAARESGRSSILVASTVGPARKQQIQTRLPMRVTLTEVAANQESATIDLEDLKLKVVDAAALYFENPSYLGMFEDELDEVRRITAEAGCRLVVGVDPTSLGIAREPGSYGADIACGELQPLGLHQDFGGNAAGFIVCALDESLVAQLPSIFISAYPTVRPNEYDFYWGNFEATSYATRGDSDDVIGCGSAMAGIVAACYLSLMGPQGMRELGEGLLARVQYLRDALNEVRGVDASRLSGTPFKELVVDFSGTGRSVTEINAALLERKIFGGLDLGADFDGLAGCMLLSVSEEHTRQDLDRLVTALKEIAR